MTMVASIESQLLSCCASPAWVAAVASEWPFADLAALLARGEQLWWGLTPDDWREALSAHPRIGDRPPTGSQEQREQAAAQDAPASVLDAIDAGNVTYQARFGMTYVVRASGRSAEQMLDMLQLRLAADPESELHTAAAQQWEITTLRVTALWNNQS